LWVEVKYDETTKGPIKPKLSALQAQWLNNRYDEGRQVIVIVGTAPSEAILYKNGGWNEGRFDRRPLNDVIADVLTTYIQ
jgi:hypothetical protein